MDVNYPDGTWVAPGARFTKTWRVQNLGPVLPGVVPNGAAAKAAAAVAGFQLAAAKETADGVPSLSEKFRMVCGELQTRPQRTAIGIRRLCLSERFRADCRIMRRAHPISPARLIER